MVRLATVRGLAFVLAFASLAATAARAQCPCFHPTRIRASDDPAGVGVLQSGAIDGEWALAARNTVGAVPAAVIFMHRVAGVWAETQIVLPIGPVASENFGSGGAEIAGDVAVVGALSTAAGSSGSAYVFRRVGTVWAQEQRLVASDGATGITFAYDVATDGARVVVGAPGNMAFGDNGSVYVYVFSAGAWNAEQKLTEPGTIDIGGFGASVQIEGGAAFVSESASSVGSPPPGYGRVHVFQHNGTAWAASQAPLTSPAPVQFDQFGLGLAFDGSTLAASWGAGKGVVLFTNVGGTWTNAGQFTGAAVTAKAVAIDGSRFAFGDPWQDILGADSGWIAVYEKQGANWVGTLQMVDSKGKPPTTLDVSGDTAIATCLQHADAMLFSLTKPEVEAFETETQKIVPATSPTGDGVSGRVASDGDNLLFGVQSDSTVGTNGGAVYAYRKIGGVWSNEMKLLGPAIGSQYGCAVAVSGDVAMVGARGENGKKGAVHILQWNGAAWVQTQLESYPFGTADEFGGSIDIDGGFAVIGADGPTNAQGRALVYERVGGSWVLRQLLTPTLAAPQATGEAGADVAISGDTIVIGAPWSFSFTNQAGVAFVYRKGPLTWKLEATLFPSDPVTVGHFASSVALDGDHAFIGGPSTGAPIGARTGQVYAWERSGTKWTQTQIIKPDQAGARSFGTDVELRGTDAFASAGAAICGTLYQYRFVGGAWTRVQRFHHTTSKPGDSLGASIALNGASVIAFEPGTAPAGTVNTYGIANVALYTFFNTPTIGEPLTFDTTGGDPNAPVLLFITGLNGAPFLFPLIQFNFDAAGAWKLPLIVPPVAGLAGVGVSFQSYTLQSGIVVGTNVRTVTFD